MRGCAVLCVCVVVVGDGDDLFVYKVRQQNTCDDPRARVNGVLQ